MFCEKNVRIENKERHHFHHCLKKGFDVFKAPSSNLRETFCQKSWESSIIYVNQIPKYAFEYWIEEFEALT